jgi:hypothetical protein
MMDEFLSPDDIMVGLDHKWGMIEISLSEWMSRGPGPHSPGLRPVRSWSQRSGEQLPLAVIPVRFRNDHPSRVLVATGQIDPPWPATDIASTEVGTADLATAYPHSGEMELCILLDQFLGNALGEEHLVPYQEWIADPRLADRRIFRDRVPAALRRLASERQWGYFESIVSPAAELGFRGIGPVLCEVLESGTYPGDPVFLVDTLALLETPEAVAVLVGQLNRCLESVTGSVTARRCLYALYGIRSPEARRALADIAQGEWPPDLVELAQYLSTHHG